MRNYLLAFSVLMLLNIPANAQPAEVLKQAIAIAKTDTAINSAIQKFLTSNPVPKPKEIISTLSQYTKQFEEKNNAAVLQTLYHEIGLSCKDLRKYDSSFLLLRKAQQQNIITKNKQTEGIILNDIGFVYYEQNVLDSALQYLFKSLEIKRQFGTPKQVAVTLNTIGLAFRTRNEITKAKSYYKEALAILEPLNDASYLRILGNLATLYNLEKKYDSATTIFNKIYNLAASKKDVGTMLFAQVNKALALNFQEKYIEALPVFEELSQNPRVKPIEDLNNAVQYGLGQALIGSKNYEKAIPILKTCLSYKFKNTKYQSLAAITNLLFIAEREQKNYQQALIYYQQVKLYNDTLTNNEKEKVIEELDKKYKTQQKEQQIQLLEKENAIKNLSIIKQNQSLQLADAFKQQKLQEIDLLNKQNEVSNLLVSKQQQTIQINAVQKEKSAQQVQLLQKDNAIKDLSIKEKKRTNWLFAAALALATIVAISVFLLYKNNQKNNKLLAEKNAIITKSLQEKEVLLKEIHHRVKNNLQVVSSLLNLQSRNISDKKALSAIKEGRDRVKSMALIHQNLYSEDNLTGVEINEYVEKLVQSLFTSYNIQNEKVSLLTDIDKLNVDVDTVIPIGLILTELISNALKYAFSETTTNGELHIALKQQNEGLLLSVKDNGVGLPADWKIENTNSLGYQLIRSFAAKMKAKLTVTGTQGTNVEMLITHYKLRA